MDYKLFTNEILCKLLKADDEIAYKEIYNRHWKAVFEAAYYRIGSKEIAKDLTQNLFLDLWKKRNTLTVNNLQNYLQTAIKNRVINCIEASTIQKKHQHHIRQATLTQSTETETTVLYNEFLRAFETALNQLPQKTRDVFKMSRFEHLSIKEIAMLLNLSEKAVEYHITASLKFLRLSLKDFMLSSLFAMATTQL